MVRRNTSEYLALLEQQYDHLLTSTEAYDAGRVPEHVRLAQSIRVLLHDTDNSTSLLTHGGWKNSIWYLNTSQKYGADNVHPTASLLYRSIGEVSCFVAPLMNRYLQPCRCKPNCTSKQVAADGFPKWVSADPWGERIVLAGPRGNGPIVVTAKQLILWVANKDGGAHVDEKLPASYHAMSRDNALDMRHQTTGPNTHELLFSGDDSVGLPVENPAAATIRQLAFEIMWSLHVYFSFEEPEWVMPNDSDSSIIGMPYQSPSFPFVPMNRVTLKRALPGQTKPEQTEKPEGTWSTTLSFKDAVPFDPRPTLGPPNPSEQFPEPTPEG